MGAMRLLGSDIKKFKMLYSHHFGEMLDDKEAQHELALLVRQCELIYQPITLTELDRLTMTRGKERRK